MIRAGSSPGAEPLGWAAMERSIRFVLFGTFTLRFSTGLTGSMLAFYLAHLPEHGGPTVDATVVGLYRGPVLRRRARPVAAVRHPVGSATATIG